MFLVLVNYNPALYASVKGSFQQIYALKMYDITDQK